MLTEPAVRTFPTSASKLFAARNYGALSSRCLSNFACVFSFGIDPKYKVAERGRPNL